MTDHIENCEIANAAQKMRDGATEMGSAVATRTHTIINDSCKDTEDMIKAQPYKSVLLALGVGMALGAWIFRR
ncbi:MAG: hypothetical protein WCT04_22800 [Planctomycetota bacterium]